MNSWMSNIEWLGKFKAIQIEILKKNIYSYPNFLRYLKHIFYKIDVVIKKKSGTSIIWLGI